SSLECTLAWMHVLRQARPEQIDPLMPSRPEFYDWPAWHELAGTVAGVVDELSAELLSLRDVARVAARMNMDREAERSAVLERNPAVKSMRRPSPRPRESDGPA